MSLRLAATLFCSFTVLLPGVTTRAADLVVGDTQQFSDALRDAVAGDRILMSPGVYDGGHFRAGLTSVTILSQNPNNRAIIRGGINGIQLSDATNVTLESLIFEQQTGNGLNIDDGGSFTSPSSGITLRDLWVRDMNAGGNNDGIKLSGVTGFLIDGVTVENWGAGGSAVDPVGSHHGLIVNSIFRHNSGGSSGVRPKGGSKNIKIFGNRFEMPGGVGRAIQAGGSTGEAFFRFIDGDSGYEADNITAAGNLIIDAYAAVSYANIDGGNFHHNWLENPRNWAVRILNENQGNPIVDTQNGAFTDNVIEYNGSSWNRPVNVGPETLAGTFAFARNQWQNTTGVTNISLPAPEADGQYGSITVPRVGDQIRWDFDWGFWVVNAAESTAPGGQALTGAENLLVATRGSSGEFNPQAADPLTGEWSFAPLNDATVQLEAQSQIILIEPDASAVVPSIEGDFDRSGIVDIADYQLWKRQFGTIGDALADGNGDQMVDAADYTVWRDALPGPTVSTVPESGMMASVGLLFLGVLPFWYRVRMSNCID